MKKADMSINVIIGFVLVLIVFAVLLFVIVNKFGFFRSSIENCEVKGGACVPADDCKCEDSNCENRRYPINYCGDGEVCCTR